MRLFDKWSLHWIHKGQRICRASFGATCKERERERETCRRKVLCGQATIRFAQNDQTSSSSADHLHNTWLNRWAWTWISRLCMMMSPKLHARLVDPTRPQASGAAKVADKTYASCQCKKHTKPTNSAFEEFGYIKGLSLCKHISHWPDPSSWSELASWTGDSEQCRRRQSCTLYHEFLVLPSGETCNCGCIESSNCPQKSQGLFDRTGEGLGISREFLSANGTPQQFKFQYTLYIYIHNIPETFQSNCHAKQRQFQTHGWMLWRLNSDSEWTWW